MFQEYCWSLSGMPTVTILVFDFLSQTTFLVRVRLKSNSKSYNFELLTKYLRSATLKHNWPKLVFKIICCKMCKYASHLNNWNEISIIWVVRKYVYTRFICHLLQIKE